MENAPVQDGLFTPVSKEERQGVEKMREPSAYWRDVYKRFVSNKVAVVFFWVIIIISLFAILGPVISPYAFDKMDLKSVNLKPFAVWAHPLGTDDFGRDLFVRLMVGSRISLAIGLVASVMVIIIGTIYGAISGYFGGWVDNIMMRIVEIISSIPSLLVIILLQVVLYDPLHSYLDAHPSAHFLRNIGASLISIFLTFGLLYWTDMARMVRGQILSVKNEEYVNAARALGARPARIIRKHLLPNAMGVIIVTAMLNIPTAIFVEAFLSFLGIGVRPPMCSLGSLASDALTAIYTYPYRLVLPSILISLIILAFYMVGDALRNALDPRMKNR